MANDEPYVDADGVASKSLAAFTSCRYLFFLRYNINQSKYIIYVTFN